MLYGYGTTAVVLSVILAQKYTFYVLCEPIRFTSTCIVFCTIDFSVESILSLPVRPAINSELCTHVMNILSDAVD